MAETRTPKQIAADKLDELIERMEKAEAGSRDLDADIAVELDGFFTVPPRYQGDDIGYGYFDQDGCRVEPGHGGMQLVRRYTASLDAAVALAERVSFDPLHGPGELPSEQRAYPLNLRSQDTRYEKPLSLEFEVNPLFPNGWAHVSRLHPDHCTERDEAACSDGKAANVAIALCLATLKAVRVHMHPRDREETSNG